jgi:hypothetical protein
LKFVRSPLSVIVGFAVFLGALQTMPSLAEDIGADAGGMNYMMFSLAFTVVAAVVSGYATAWIAGAHEFPHAATVGFLMIATSFVSVQQAAISKPSWYQITIGGCGPVSVLIGAAIRVFVRLRQPATAKENTSGEASRL